MADHRHHRGKTCFERRWNIKHDDAQNKFMLEPQKGCKQQLWREKNEEKKTVLQQ